jgi:hypothetical protein
MLAVRLRLRGIAAIVATLGPAISGRAVAQQPSDRSSIAERSQASPPPRTIVGTVLDTGGVPIDSVELRIASLQRRTFSDPNGVFRFENVKPGSYDVAARRLGFAPQIRRVTVRNDRGGTIAFALVRVAYVLTPVVTSSPRGGLSGVIGDTAFNLLRGAEVYVIGSGRRARTDSAGAFFLDVKPGSYMVQVTNPGFSRKLLSVTIPKDSGRHITVWIAPSKGRGNPREAHAIEALRTRMLLRRATARFYSREDLKRHDMAWLTQLVVMGSGMPVADDCDAVIDGLWLRRIYSLTLDDLESVEVYPPGSLYSTWGSMRRTTPPTSIDPRGTQPRPVGRRCPTVFVWTRD